mmetsp:Transcript_73608/g.193102  ORF Transcript_73608/g.193102 Transcript_73608/m.193102 type:complete len:797 (-) Transcript_73608:17-2407(-)
MPGEVGVEPAGQRGGREAEGRLLDDQDCRLGLAPAELDVVPVRSLVQRVLVASPNLHVQALAQEEGLGVLQELLRRHPEDEAVDRLELQAWVVDVHELHQREPGRMLWRRALPLEILPAPFGRGQRMVSVAHCEQQHPLIRAGAVALAEELRVREAPQSCHSALDGLPRRDAVPSEASRALHEVEVVELLVPVPVPHQGLDDGLARVVDEHQDVRQLHGRPLPDGDARRQALLDGHLRGPHERLRALLVGVHVEVELHQEAVARRDDRRLAAEEDHPRRAGLKDPRLLVLAHLVVDALNDLLVPALVEVDLREDQVQGGGGVSDQVPNLLPVLGLRRVLVARNAGPLAWIHAWPRQQELRDAQADVLEVQPVSAGPERGPLLRAEPRPEAQRRAALHLRVAHRVARQVHHVAQQDGHGHVPHAARHRRHEADLLRLMVAHVADDAAPAALLVGARKDDRHRVHPDVDNHRAPLQPGALHEAGPPHAGDHHVRAAHVVLDAPGLRVAHRHRAVALLQHQRHRSADRARAAEDHGLLPRQRHAGLQQDLDDGGRRQRRGERVAATAAEEPPVARMEALHVLLGTDGAQHLLLVEVRGQRQLHQDAVHGPLVHELADGREQLGLSHVFREAQEASPEPAALGQLRLQVPGARRPQEPARIEGAAEALVRRPVDVVQVLQHGPAAAVAHLDDDEQGRDAMRLEHVPRLPGDVRADLGGDILARAQRRHSRLPAGRALGPPEPRAARLLFDPPGGLWGVRPPLGRGVHRHQRLVCGHRHLMLWPAERGGLNARRRRTVTRS